ncbi:MAG: tyrosine recombinase XerC [Acidimicrobiia bacterium]
MKLGDVTGGTLTALYGQLGERLAPKTIKNTHTLLHRAYRDAVAWGLVAANPADNANPPKVRRSEPQTWDSAQLGKLFAVLEGDRLSSMWRLFATTGLRRAEVLGLKWSAVDLERGFLSVVRTRTEYAGQPFEKDTKTAAGRRRVSLDPYTVGSLREYRRRQLEERLSWGEGWQDTGLAFTKEDGSPIRPAWVTAQLPKLASTAGYQG